MRKIVLLFLSVVLIGGNLLLTGCEVDYYQEPEPTEGSGSSIFEEGVTVPEGFNWSTVKTGELSVKVDDRYNGQYFYQVEVYDANPIIYRDAGLLAKGVAKKGQDWIGSLSLPAALETVYVRQVSPVGQGVVKAGTLSENGIKVDFTPGTPSRTGTRMASSGVSQGSIPMSTRSGGLGDEYLSTNNETPADAEVIDNTKSDITLVPNWSTGGAHRIYVLRGEYTGKITFNGGGPGVTLYIEGTWTNTSPTTISLGAKDKLIIQNGGKFISTSATILQGSLYNYGDIEMNGKLTTNSSTTIENKGNLIINNGDLQGTFLNEGTVQVLENLKGDNSNFYLTNTKTGNFEVKTFNDPGKIVNDGVMKISGILNAGSSFTSITNRGFFEVQSLGTSTTSAQGTINNSGQFIATKAYIELTFNIATGGLFEVGNLTMLNSSINLKHEAMLVVTEKLTIANSGNKKLITGPANGDALARINEVSFIDAGGQIGRGFELGGELEVECSNYTVLPEPGNTGEGKTTGEDVRFVKVGESTAKIPATDYNKGGNNNVVPGTPSNPVFPIIFDGSPLTYMFEDNWPYLGDYDMNDVVLDVVPTYTIESNKVTELGLNVTLRAVGATKRLAVGIQLDGITPGDISSVTRVNDAGLNGQVFTRSNGLESGQTYAVIPVFDDAHSAFSHSSGLMTNTIKGSENNKGPVNVEFTIVFNSPTDLGTITVDKFNVFIINGGYKGKRSEIHMPGFAPTDKADKARLGDFDDNSLVKYYTSKNNMIWGLAIPGPAKYPIEWSSINDAYKQLQGWATSAGSDNKDWYKYPDEGKIFGN